MNTVMSGAAVTQVRDGIYLIDVVMRATDEQRVSLSTLRNLQFPLPDSRTVPLGVFAVLDFEQEFPLIWRRDAVPTLTVQADVTQDASPEAVINALAPAVAKLEASLPKSYHIAVGGTIEESAQSQASVYAVVALMLFITITLLMMQLQSFSLLFLVLSVVPMGLIGVIAALLIFNKRSVSSGRRAWRYGMPSSKRRRPDSSDHADSDINGSRHDPDCVHHILGADGLRDYGRIASGNPAHIAFPSCALCCLVPRQGADPRQGPADAGSRAII
jgi:AcrB/AcrD/AcrF family